MRTLLLASALVIAATPAWSGDRDWTGPYIGAHVGGAWGNATTRDDPKDWGTDPKFVGPFDQSPSGVIAGATVGYGYQIGSIVAGIEGDLGYLDLSSGLATPSSQSGNHQDITVSGGLYGDVTGRLGALLTPSTLVYGKGGFAFFNGEARQATTADGYKTNGTSTFTGWVVGGGIEQRLTETISVRIEYLHFDFGSQGGDQTNVGDESSPAGYKFRNTTKLDADTVKVGVSYRF